MCENNKYSVYSNLKQRQPKNRKLYKLAKSFGIDSYYLSSKDPIKLCENLKKILNTKKPIFIEIDTYRYYEQCGPNKDEHLNYRPRRELKYWIKKDPVKIVENYLLKKKILSHSQLNLIKKKFSQKYLAHLNLQKKLRPLRSKNMKD